MVEWLEVSILKTQDINFIGNKEKIVQARETRRVINDKNLAGRAHEEVMSS